MSQPIVGMDLADLREALGPRQPAYRARQIYDAVYRRGASDLIKITTLPSTVRQDLEGRHGLGLPSIEHL